MARKTPILLRVGPLTNEVYAVHDYTMVKRPGLDPMVQVKGNGKQSVQADYDALVLTELIGEHAPDIMEILDGAMKGYYTLENPMPESEVLQVRAFRQKLEAMIERHNARHPEGRSDDVVS